MAYDMMTQLLNKEMNTQNFNGDQWTGGAYQYGNTTYSPAHMAAANLMNRMKFGGSSASASGGGVGALAGKAYGAVEDWTKSAGPQWSDNRFEKGLSDTEGRLSSLLSDPSSIQQSAAYKFRLGQGQEALQRQQGAAGMLGSGNRLMELTKYGQDMASQEYDNQFSRLQGLYGTQSGAWNQDMSSLRQAHLGKGNVLADLFGKTADAETQRYSVDVNAQNNLQAAALRAALSYAG